MTDASGFVLLYSVASALLLVIARAVELRPEQLTPFELQRRLQAHDERAYEIQLRQQRLPRLLALRRVIELIALVGVGASLTVLYGWIVGGFAAVVVLLGIDALAGRSVAKRLAARVYGRVDEWLLDAVESWRWLDIIKEQPVLPADSSVSSKSELIDLIKRSRGVLSADEATHLQRTLTFDDIAVHDIMTPRSMIDSVAADEVIGPLVLDQLHKTGHSRIPVIDSDIDHVVGVLYLRDLVSVGKAAQHRTVADAMRPEVFYIRQDKHLEHALHAFLRTHHHMCIVVNEFRETVGLLTLEDVIEALLGRHIVDEFDEFEDLRKVAESNPRANNEPKGRKDV